MKPLFICSRFLPLFALIGALVSAPAAGQVTATKLNPLDEWQAELSDGLCTISRNFGRATAPTRIELRNRDPWNGGFDVAISSARFAATDAPFTAGWLPGGRIVTIHRPSYEDTGQSRKTVVFRHGLWDGAMPASGTPEYEQYWSRDEAGEIIGPLRFKQNVESFLVNGAFERPLLFATGPMDAVLDARDACIDEMLVSKGIDPSVEDRDDHRVELTNHRSLARVIFRRIPETMRFAQNWGGVTFLVFLDSNASITACHLNSMPYDADYEKFGCDQLRSNARFRFKDGETPQPAFFKLHASLD